MGRNMYQASLNRYGQDLNLVTHKLLTERDGNSWFGIIECIIIMHILAFCYDLIYIHRPYGLKSNTFLIIICIHCISYSRDNIPRMHIMVFSPAGLSLGFTKIFPELNLRWFL